MAEETGFVLFGKLIKPVTMDKVFYVKTLCALKPLKLPMFHTIRYSFQSGFLSVWRLGMLQKEVLNICSAAKIRIVYNKPRKRLYIKSHGSTRNFTTYHTFLKIWNI